MSRARLSRDRSLGTGQAELVCVTIAAAASVSHRLLPARARMAANLGAATLATLAARRAGLSWSELGLGTDAVGRGLAWGVGSGAVVGATVVASASRGSVRRRFADERVASQSSRRAAFEMSVRIPLETAFAEELLFRGALLGLAMRHRHWRLAIVTSSALFGAWHVLPTWSGFQGSAVASLSPPGRFARSGTVGGVVVATAAAGVAFAALRLRSRSLAAPVLVHAALNVTSFAVARVTAPSDRDRWSGGTPEGAVPISGPASGEAPFPNPPHND